MNRTKDNKRPIEQIFVAKAGVTTAHAAGQPLTNATTGSVDLVNGQIKVFSYGGYGTTASNQTISAGQTVVNAPDIFIVQGNPSASNPANVLPYPLETRPYEKSEPLVGNNKIIYTYKAAKRPTYDTVIIGDTVGNAGAINVLDESTYALKIAFYGKDFDEAYSGTHPNSLTPSYTSKDYTTLGYTAVKATDDIVQNLAYIVNKNSKALSFTKGFQAKKPIIAFAVDTTGTQGINPVTATVGTAIPVVNTNVGLKTIILTQEIKSSFAASGIPSGAKIIPIDLSLAGTGAAGTSLLGPDGVAYSPAVLSGEADALILMALDRDIAYEDRTKQVKARIDVGLFDGFNFNTVKNAKIQKAFEGEGLSRQWKMFYKDTAGQRKYSAYRGFEEMKTEYPVPIVDGTYYDAAIIEHYHADLIGTDTIVKPFKAIILIPNVDSSGTLTPDAGAVALVTTIILPWINSTNSPIVSILG